MLFHLIVDFCGHYCCICCCWFLSSSLFLVNNPNTYTYSHANTHKHGLNFNVKWRATKYNGNLSKFHYDIPLHNVIRAVVFFFGRKTFFVSTTLFHTPFICCGCSRCRRRFVCVCVRYMDIFVFPLSTTSPTKIITIMIALS